MSKIYYAQHKKDKSIICIYDEQISRIVYLNFCGDACQCLDAVNKEDILIETQKEADEALTELWNIMRP